MAAADASQPSPDAVTKRAENYRCAFERSGRWPPKIFSSTSVHDCRAGLLEGTAQTGPVPSDLLFEALSLGRASRWQPAMIEQLLDLVVDLQHFENANPLCTMEQSFEHFRQQLLRFSCERPPWTVGLFNRDQVTAITGMMLAHHYRHFALHKFLHAEEVTVLELVEGA
mmetsp:Transcript_16312/g.41423  ORF Transcript_16312/g.41423 Transcript_16312/m.41423 type:complete len:169 (+) Transcript_16312:59-565(+)|eukprot:CAMPEP_0202051930 /NCGR_PEP_ID=MMETSP0963-20130614/4934_1 /ASSEMBLY_ACC=CAM_ASM_000494 /TAXON_ID=4773 /ORGANISM="Schizochytrium aggregatum, Strain ATCC28209" /LENGTH=168 /DNA_ID=CAMNT_0048617145 /DNA_START=56 /DNA_END=562 /DNA_ORIENTATION=+